MATIGEQGKSWRMAWLACLWLGGCFFAVYMWVTYAWSGWHQRFALWNTLLGNLYVPKRPLATLGIGLHVMAGSIIVLIGPLQLIPSLRERRPGFHRALGRIYLVAALVACFGGNLFIFLNGTVGGPVMSVAFSLYGWLLGLCALQAGRMAMKGDIVEHRKWALRLFALGIGPLLYRIEYGLWALCFGMKAHYANWKGPLDYVMDFFFYVPNLIVCEVYLRVAHQQASATWQRWALPVAAALGVCFVALGLVLVVPYWWLPVAKKVWLHIP